MALPKKAEGFPGAVELPNPAKLEAEANGVEYVANVAPAFKGAHTYRLTQPHYRLDVTYDKGELVTVVDEKPGSTWVKVSVDAAPEAPVDPLKKK